MKKFDGYLLVSDIDGTLAEGRYIPPANKAAIERFINAGGQVVLATGRSPQSSLPVAKALGCDGKIIANNGALVYDIKTDSIVIEYTVDCEQISHDVIEKFEDAGGMFYCGCDLCLIKENWVMTQLIKSEQLTVTDLCTSPTNKVIFGGTPELLDKIEQYCQGHPHLHGELVRSDDTFIEILPTGIDKGSTMTNLAAQMGIDKSRIFAAGNFFNDVNMMSAAAYSCAPSDSPQEVKSMADYVACPCRDGAVAEFIDQLFEKY